MVVTKLVRKLMLAMMELFILILLDVQANDLALTSLCMSSPPNLFPYSFEVDEAEGMYKCITNVVEGCESTKKTWPLSDLRYQNCMFKGFFICFHHVNIFEHPPIFKDCVYTKCLTKSNIGRVSRSSPRVSKCFLKCYEKHIKMPSNVIYTQIP
jgi:hypothetical protein